MSWGGVFSFLAWVWGVAALGVLGRRELLEGWNGAMEALRQASSGWLPAGGWLLPNLAYAAGAIALAIALIAVADALGRRMMVLIVPRPSRGLAMTAAFGGWAVVALAILGAAAVGLCRPAVVAGLLAAGCALGARRIVEWPGRVARAASDAWSADRVVAAGLVLVALGNLPRFVLPEHNEDCLMYHLALPQQLLLRGHLPQRPGYWAWGLPLLADFPNTVAVMCRLDAAARLTGFGLAWLGSAACVRSLAPALSNAWTALLAILPLLVPEGNWVLLTAKDDLPVCGLWLAAAAAAMEAGVWRRRGMRPAAGAWTSLLAGCTVASKLALGPAVAAVAATALVPARGGGIVAVWAAAAALPVVPWMLRAWFEYGDPVHPFGAAALPGWFGVGGNGRNIRVELAGVVHEGVGRAASAREALVMLWNNAYPAVAAAPLLVAAAGAPGWWALAASVAGAVALAVATPGGHTHLPRFALPACALVNAIAFGVAAREISARRSRSRSPAPSAGGGKKKPRPAPVSPPPGASPWPPRLAALACCAAVAILLCRLDPVVSWNEESPGLRGRAWLAGRMDTEGYRRSLMGSWGIVQPAVAAGCAGSPRSSVLVIGAKFLWGIPARIVTNEMGLRPVWDAASSSSSPGRTAVRFRQMGIGLVAYDMDYAAWDRNVVPSYPWTDRALRVLTEFEKRWYRYVVSDACRTPGFGMHWVFEVTRRPGPPARRVAVVPGADPAWATAALALGRGDIAGGLAEAERIRGVIPDVVAADAFVGQIYQTIGSYEEAYPLVKAAAEAGFLNCANPMLLDWAAAAYMTGRYAEADRVHERVRQVYDRWEEALRPRPAAPR